VPTHQVGDILVGAPEAGHLLAGDGIVSILLITFNVFCCVFQTFEIVNNHVQNLFFPLSDQKTPFAYL
jgi:hypothetical protein